MEGSRMTSQATKNILVTGGNSGIGLALCRQLAVDHACRVFMGSRSLDRGGSALEALRSSLPRDCVGSIELLPVDVGEDESVASAAESLRASLDEGEQLYGLVNNAGTGLQAASSPEEVINTNLVGAKRMVDGRDQSSLPRDWSGPDVSRIPSPSSAWKDGFRGRGSEVR